MIAPVQQYPALWLLAALNLAALVIAIVGSFLLSIRKKDWAWLPVGAALFIAYGVSWTGKMWNGRIPAIPYLTVQRVDAGARALPVVSVSYNFDFIAIGIAAGVIIASKRKK